MSYGEIEARLEAALSDPQDAKDGLNYSAVFAGCLLSNWQPTHMSSNTLLYALYRMGYKSRMTGHGFRGLASTETRPLRAAWLQASPRELGHDHRNTHHVNFERSCVMLDNKSPNLENNSHVQPSDAFAPVRLTGVHVELLHPCNQNTNRG